MQCGNFELYECYKNSKKHDASVDSQPKIARANAVQQTGDATVARVFGCGVLMSGLQISAKEIAYQFAHRLSKRAGYHSVAIGALGILGGNQNADNTQSDNEKRNGKLIGYLTLLRAET